MPLTRSELDTAGCACGAPDCPDDGLFWHSRCHPDTPTWGEYRKSTGVLILRCAECEKPVQSFYVAREAPAVAS